MATYVRLTHAEDAPLKPFKMRHYGETGLYRALVVISIIQSLIVLRTLLIFRTPFAVHRVSFVTNVDKRLKWISRVKMVS